jgi:hypothetical protein
MQPSTAVKPASAVLALLLALLPAACRTGADGSAPVSVAYTTLAEGSGGDLPAAPQGVIRTAAGFEQLWRTLQASEAMPQVDFRREMVVYAAQAGVERVLAQGGFLQVELAARDGGYHVVRLARNEAPVQFVQTR